MAPIGIALVRCTDPDQAHIAGVAWVPQKEKHICSGKVSAAQWGVHDLVYIHERQWHNNHMFRCVDPTPDTKLAYVRCVQRRGTSGLRAPWDGTRRAVYARAAGTRLVCVCVQTALVSAEEREPAIGVPP